MAITENIDIVINESGGRTVKRSLDDIADSAQRGVQPVNNLNSAIGNGASVTDIFYGSLKRLAGVLATIKLGSLISESATLSQRYNELGIVLGVVGRNAGLARAEVDETTESVRKQGISMIESRQIVTRLIQANIDLSKATQLARLAQDAAVIGQVNSSEALNRLVFGITSAQVEVLRGIGINVNFEQSYAKLAAQMGVTQNSLTEQQKLQARLNVVLGEASKITGVYEGAMENAGKQMRSTERLVEDLKVKIGGLFDQTSIFAVTAYTNALKDADSSATKFTETGQLKAWGDAIARISAFAADSIRSVGIVFDITGKAIGAMAAQVVALSKFDFGSAVQIQSDFNKDFDAAIGGMSKMRDMVESQIIQRDLLTKTTERETISLKSNSVAQVENADGAKKQRDEYEKLISSIQEKIALNNAEIESVKKLSESEKLRIDIDQKIKDGTLELNAAKKESIAAALKELDVSEKLLANKQFVRQQSEALAGIGNNQTNALRQQLDEIRAQNALIGLNKDQIVALAGAKNLETAAVIRNAAVYAGDMHDAYIQYANDLETAAGLQKQIVQEQQIQDYAQAWRQGWSSIEQTARNAFVQFSAHGVSAVESIGQAIKTSIIDALYQLTVRKWIINIGASIEGALLNGAAGSVASGSGIGIGNILSTGSNLLSSFGGGVGSLIGRGASALGFTSFGAGASGAASAGVFGAGGLNFLGGAGTALGTGAEFGITAGLGASMAAIAGPLIAVDIAGRLFGGNKTLGGAEMIPVIGGFLAGLFGHGPLKFRQQSLQGDVSSVGFDGDITNVFRAKGGLLVGNKHKSVAQELSDDQQKTFDAAITGFYKSTRGFAENLGLSTDLVDNFTQQIQIKSEKGKQITEEAITGMLSGIGDSLAKNVFPSVDEFRKVGESSAQTLSRLSGELTVLSNAAELLFGKSAAQSKSFINQFGFGDRTAFLDKAGGTDAFAAMVSGFAQNFLTDDQRMRPIIESLVSQRDSLGLGGINTRDQYVSTVQSGSLKPDQLLFLLKNQDAINQVFTYLEKIGKVAPSAASGLASVTRELNVTDADRTEYGQRLNRSINETTQAITELEGIANQLRGTVNQINPLSVNEARGIVSSGNAHDPRLQSALSTLSGMGTGEFSNVIDFQRAKAQNVASISSLQNSITSQIAAKNKELDQFNFEKLMFQAALQQASEMFSQAASFDVGGRVPKTGMAIIHKDEQVLTPGQQDSITSEIQQLRKELGAALNLIAKHTEKTAELIDLVTAGGNAMLMESV